MAGDVQSPIFIVKNYARTLKKPRIAKKTEKIDKRIYDDFVIYKNQNAWMTREIFRDVLSDFNKKLEAENKNCLLLLDNAQGHKIDVEYRRIKIEYFQPNLTPLIQPQDQAYYSTVKSRFQKFRRDFMVTRDQCPTVSEMFEKISAITLGFDAEFVKTCWKMCGLLPLTNTTDESAQIANAISNMNLNIDDEYEICESEPDRDREDDLIELVPIPIESALTPPTPTADKKKIQQPITNYFTAKKE